MKFRVKEILENDPCQDTLAGLSEIFFGKILSFYSWSERADIILDTCLYNDDALNKMNLNWFYAHMDSVEYKTMSFLDGTPFREKGLIFVEAPAGKAVGFYNKEDLGPRFVDGDMIQVKNWRRISIDEADYFSMVLTDLGEWSYFDDYVEAKRNEEMDFLHEYYN